MTFCFMAFLTLIIISCIIALSLGLSRKSEYEDFRRDENRYSAYEGSYHTDEVCLIDVGDEKLETEL